MNYIITRENGRVIQYWEDNDASWDFFLESMSRDVQWRNDSHSPKKFRSFGEAKWYLDMRAKRLKSPEKKQEAQWIYRILEVMDK